MRRNQSGKDKTVTTTKERVNTLGGYRITTTTTTRHDKGLLDIFIDLFS